MDGIVCMRKNANQLAGPHFSNADCKVSAFSLTPGVKLAGLLIVHTNYIRKTAKVGNMSKAAIIAGVGAALGLFTLTLIEEHVLGSVDNIGCVAAPLAATAAMIFADRSAADIKSIVG